MHLLIVLDFFFQLHLMQLFSADALFQKKLDIFVAYKNRPQNPPNFFQ